MKSRRRRREGHKKHIGDRRGAKGFWWKKMGDGDYLKGPGLYGRITLKWIFRLIQIVHMTLGQQSRKN
jgi:hypothetical protein